MRRSSDGSGPGLRCPTIFRRSAERALASNLYYAFGHQHLGSTLRPASPGKALGALIDGEPGPLDLAPVRSLEPIRGRVRGIAGLVSGRSVDRFNIAENAHYGAVRLRQAVAALFVTRNRGTRHRPVPAEARPVIDSAPPRYFQHAPCYRITGQDPTKPLINNQKSRAKIPIYRAKNFRPVSTLLFAGNGGNHPRGSSAPGVVEQRLRTPAPPRPGCVPAPRNAAAEGSRAPRAVYRTGTVRSRGLPQVSATTLVVRGPWVGRR